jgi:putative phosphoesterase
MEQATRVAAIYDVHGNQPALKAVLSDLKRVESDLVVVGGDVASGPMPVEVLDLLQAVRDRVLWVRGNADREVVAAYDGGPRAIEALMSDPALAMDGWAASRIGKRQRDLLASFSESVEVDIEGIGAVLFCHATPNSDEEIVTTVTPDGRLRGILAGTEQDVVVCGHVHTQYDRRLDDKRVINAGSVGLPYQGEPVGAFWTLLGTEGIELRRSDYELRTAVEEFRAVGYPAVDDIAESLLEPPDPSWVAELFERQANDRPETTADARRLTREFANSPGGREIL